jgi:hypothetical protein
MMCLDITLLMLLKETDYTDRIPLDTSGPLMWIEILSDLRVATPFLFVSSPVSCDSSWRLFLFQRTWPLYTNSEITGCSFIGLVVMEAVIKVELSVGGFR